MSNYDDIINGSLILPNDLPEISGEMSHTYIPNTESMRLDNRKKDFKAEKPLEDVEKLFEFESDEPSSVKKKTRK